MTIVALETAKGRVGLSLVSFYLRLWCSAKPFESPELDDLAARMSVAPMLSPNPKERWYEGRGSIGYSFRNRVIFGKRLLVKLTDGQLLAVAAHELIHVRENDSRYANRHIVYPALLVGLATFFLSFVAWRSLPASALLSVIIWPSSTFLLFHSSAGWRRRAELRCDIDATPYVNGNDLSEVLRIQDSLIPAKSRKTAAFRLASRMYPLTTEREHAIRNVMHSIGQEQRPPLLTDAPRDVPSSGLGVYLQSKIAARTVILELYPLLIFYALYAGVVYLYDWLPSIGLSSLRINDWVLFATGPFSFIEATPPYSKTVIEGLYNDFLFVAILMTGLALYNMFLSRRLKKLTTLPTVFLTGVLASYALSAIVWLLTGQPSAGTSIIGFTLVGVVLAASFVDFLGTIKRVVEGNCGVKVWVTTYATLIALALALYVGVSSYVLGNKSYPFHLDGGTLSFAILYARYRLGDSREGSVKPSGGAGLYTKVTGTMLHG